jgi:hypothetical protein
MVSGMLLTAAAVSPEAEGPDMAVMGMASPEVSFASAEGQQQVYRFKV